jgi:superkiller protein 3
MGFALFQQGKSEEAIASLEKALKIDPKHYKAHNNMALASIDMGELELAEIHYRESLAIEPQASIYNDLGYVLERQGMVEEAIEAYRSALEIDPQSATSHFNLATHLAREKQYAEAEKHLREALKTRQDAKVYTGLGAVLWQQGRADEAIENLQIAILEDPASTSASDTLGKILMAQGKLEQAASTYRLLAEHSPSAVAYNGEAQALSELGQTAEAKALREKAEALEAN